MIIDSSVVVAMLENESGHQRYVDKISETDDCRIAAPNYLECAMVIGARYGETGLQNLESLIDRADIRIVAFEPGHARVATDAFLAYGKGRHPARLNFGDCIAYAVARAEAMPLLFCGGDFALTDIESALAT